MVDLEKENFWNLSKEQLLEKIRNFKPKKDGFSDEWSVEGIFLNILGFNRNNIHLQMKARRTAKEWLKDEEIRNTFKECLKKGLGEEKFLLDVLNKEQILEKIHNFEPDAKQIRQLKSQDISMDKKFLILLGIDGVDSRFADSLWKEQIKAYLADEDISKVVNETLAELVQKANFEYAMRKLGNKEQILKKIENNHPKKTFAKLSEANVSDEVKFLIVLEVEPKSDNGEYNPAQLDMARACLADKDIKNVLETRLDKLAEDKTVYALGHEGQNKPVRKKTLYKFENKEQIIDKIKSFEPDESQKLKLLNPVITDETRFLVMMGIVPCSTNGSNFTVSQRRFAVECLSDSKVKEVFVARMKELSEKEIASVITLSKSEILEKLNNFNADEKQARYLHDSGAFAESKFLIMLGVEPKGIKGGYAFFQKAAVAKYFADEDIKAAFESALRKRADKEEDVFSLDSFSDEEIADKIRKFEPDEKQVRKLMSAKTSNAVRLLVILGVKSGKVKGGFTQDKIDEAKKRLEGEKVKKALGERMKEVRAKYVSVSSRKKGELSEEQVLSSISKFKPSKEQKKKLLCGKVTDSSRLLMMLGTKGAKYGDNYSVSQRNDAEEYLQSKRIRCAFNSCMKKIAKGNAYVMRYMDDNEILGRINSYEPDEKQRSKFKSSKILYESKFLILMGIVPEGNKNDFTKVQLEEAKKKLNDEEIRIAFDNFMKRIGATGGAKLSESALFIADKHLCGACAGAVENLHEQGKKDNDREDVKTVSVPRDYRGLNTGNSGY